MSFICAITNEVPQVPVIGKNNGYVYEKRLLEKYLTINNTDPLTGEKATMDDYTEVKTVPQMKPKPPSASSVPDLLKGFQDEWDALMLYTFAQKQHEQTLKQELSHSLYQYDSSCRVISRLNKEVAAAREALSTLKPQTGTGPHHGMMSSEMEVDQEVSVLTVQEPLGLDNEMETKIINCSKVLTSERKKKMKQMPEDLAKVNDIEKYVQKDAKSGFHSANIPGILSLDVSKRDSNIIITGGNDKNAVVYNTNSSQIISVLKGHNKKVTSVILHPTDDVAITSSPDCTIRVWNINKSSCNNVIRAHSSAVTGISLHALNKYVLSSGSDGYWSFSDIENGSLIIRKESKNKRTDQPNLFTCMKSHPDGLICANGTEDGEVIIWSLKESREVALLTHSLSSSVSSLAFSENGFYLATGGTDGVIKLWDLRKVKEFKSFTPESRVTYQIKDLEFDVTGSYLGVAGSDVRVYSSQQWEKSIVTFDNHTSLATGIRFGEHAKTIVSSGLDRFVRIFGLEH